MLLALGSVTSWPATADESAPSSSLTKSGTGEFAGLEVTVSQTADLVNQVITVSWTGGRRTFPSDGSFGANYLQIMQCWGDDEAAGPSRDQCQFGGLATNGDTRGGAFVTTRQLTYGSLVDPAETEQPEDGEQVAYAPFRSVTGVVERGPRSQFFSASTTNELPFGRTLGDGTGLEYFEAQTALEAPGLGCGAPRADASADGSVAPCWLVVVPRSDRDVDGSRIVLSGDKLQSSPLSASNWAHRIVFPLRFNSLATACELSGAHPLSGQEAPVEAVVRWQNETCKDDGPSFSYTPLTDIEARRQLVGSNPDLVFISRPPEKSAVPAAHPVVYAPTTLSGIVIAFNIDRQSDSSAPASVKEQDGQKVPELRLTPRLVAKLLTQSYRLAVHPTATYLAGNPYDLTRDQDFLSHNPMFRELSFPFPGIPELLLPFKSSDATRQVWEWIAADAEAQAFLAGQPDPWGMRVNPRYAGMSLPLDDFPKRDDYCRTNLPPDGHEECTIAMHPYANNFLATAQSASKGDTLTKFYDPNALPKATYKSSPAQPSGARAVLAVTDAARAARYGLFTAKLRNVAGEFVAPDAAGLLAGVEAMSPAEAAPSVLAPDYRSTDAAAYPLTNVTYAATAPSRLRKAEGRAYGQLLRYAVSGKAQVQGVKEGQLPYGYAPLPADLREQALDAADRIAAGAGVPVAVPSPTPTPRATTTPTPRPTAATTPRPTVSSSARPTAASAISASVSPSPTPAAQSPAPTPSPSASPSAAATPAASGSPSPTERPSSSAADGGGTGAAPSVPTSSSPSASATASPSATPTAPSAPPVQVVDVQPVALTPADPVGAVRFVVLGVVALGLLAGVAVPILYFLPRRDRP
ncbi:hypothetical protein [Motilibacter deserti]|uniref:PBP domain-containing protein n=1 Tax=Motilibacter deserti TaxID=2714956 RepID=A0ABX0GXM0_9ACTN|nr:hypothetical protein [Motilibacter deserti]NHC14856.1 hypothetical protein [Motilibacter deserti]